MHEVSYLWVSSLTIRLLAEVPVSNIVVANVVCVCPFISELRFPKFMTSVSQENISGVTVKGNRTTSIEIII